MTEHGINRAAFLRLLAGGCTGALLAGTRAAPGRAAAPIARRAIPSSGEALPVVGLGTWRQFDEAPDSPRIPQLREVLRLLFAGGGSVIDTSPMYGRAESRLGELLSDIGKVEQAFLATKVWTRGRRDGIAQMQRSRALLHTRSIDLMQVHNLLDLETHLPTLRAWKRDGRIRYTGATHYTTDALDDLARVIEDERPDFVQLAYSIGVRAAEREVLPLARKRGVAVLVNRPYEGGGVFGRVRGRPVPDWARGFGAETWGQFFLKFILAHPAVTCVIPGTNNPQHMSDNLGAGRGRMPDAAERRRMIDLWDEMTG